MAYRNWSVQVAERTNGEETYTEVLFNKDMDFEDDERMLPVYNYLREQLGWFNIDQIDWRDSQTLWIWD